MLREIYLKVNIIFAWLTLIKSLTHIDQLEALNRFRLHCMSDSQDDNQQAGDLEAHGKSVKKNLPHFVNRISTLPGMQCIYYAAANTKERT